MRIKTTLEPIARFAHRPDPPKPGEEKQLANYNVRNEDGVFILSTWHKDDLAAWNDWGDLLKTTGAWPDG
jgi:hypothetical protein